MQNQQVNREQKYIEKDGEQQALKQNPNPNQQKNLDMANSNMVKQQLKTLKTMNKQKTIGTKVADIAFDLSKEKELQRPNPKKKQEEIERTHIMKEVKGQRVPYTCCDVCCSSYTGRHGCFSTSEKSVFNDLGVGLTLYFKYVKYIICMLVLFIILSIPSFYFSIRAYTNVPDYDKSTLTNYIMATTIGSIGLDTNQCQRISYSALSDDGSKTTTLKCQSGYLGIVDTFKHGLIQSSSQSTRSNTKVQNCQYIDRTTLNTDYNIASLPDEVYECDHQKECVFTYSQIKEFFISSSDSTLTDGAIYIGADCLEAEVDLPGGKSISKYQLAFIIASIDAGIIVIFCISICMLKVDETKEEHILQKQKLWPNQFTIQLSSLPKLQSTELVKALKSHFDKINLREKNAEDKVKIVDIKVAESNSFQVLQKEIGQLQQKKRDLIVKFLIQYDKKNIFAKKKCKIEAIESEVIVPMETKTLKQKKEKLHAMKDIGKIKNIKVKINNKIHQYTALSQRKQNINYAWVTFETIHQRDIAYRKLFRPAITRFFKSCCCCSCCKDVDTTICKTVVRVQNAPSPDTIQWQNLYTPSLERFLRRIISIIICIAFLVASFLLIIYIRNVKDEALQKYPKVDCSQDKFQTIQESQVIEEYNQSDQETQEGYISCYCRKHLNSLIKNNLHGEIKTICADWSKNYLYTCLLYTSDAADDMQCVDLGGRRIIKKKKKKKKRKKNMVEQANINKKQNDKNRQ
eukprot:TRINITY_DN1206_c0_g1_i7.p1 TRINITY_DN1206_c0_g1~~TRINITY_DN1206_c0_g1_i7.p1  ORF type:complete len:744 (+),score=124.66 TRINITY_DN1206_c0_g1_i7:165-2396(+)